MKKKKAEECEEFEVEWLKERFAEQFAILHEILKEIRKMAIDQATFDTDLANLTNDVATLVTEVNLLIAKVGGVTAVDLTTEDDSVKATDVTVQTAIAAAKAVTGQ